MRKLFGTDGIRGVAGESPLDPATVFAVGHSLGQWIARRHAEPEVVIGMDTRESGPWIAAHLAAGLAQRGVRTRFAGVVTTPGIAYLARIGPFSAGVMISASHNPYHDNGIKIIDHFGYKLPDNEEHSIEGEIFEYLSNSPKPARVPLTEDPGLDRQYLDYLASTFSSRLDGLRVVVDAAHGSASRLGPALFERFGASVDAIGVSPDGKNINLRCGSLHLDALRARVLSTGADLGMAFDGDADRALFVSHSGRVIDGDMVLMVTGLHLHARKPLKEIVATVMSNLGLERALKPYGIELVRTPVGDKYVLEEMRRRHAPLGGEQSGHVIFHEYATTGDGLLTALRVLEAIMAARSDLDELTAGFRSYPQKLINVPVRHRTPIDELSGVSEAIREAEQEFGDAGRVLVRFSGTEPLARVMVEGPDEARVDENARRIAAAIEAEIGGRT